MQSALDASDLADECAYAARKNLEVGTGFEPV